VDWLARRQPRRPIGVAGYGEGGLVALHSAALDARIEAALVSGYFRSRRGVWEEPIYRNVWGLLRGFGDAELARMVAPRGLVIEASRHPEVTGPPPERESRRGAAPGRISTPEIAEVRAECERAGTKPVLVESGGARELLRLLAPKAAWRDGGGGHAKPPVLRMQRQFEQLVEFTQRLVRASEAARREFWSQVDAASLDGWQRTAEPYRRRLWEEVIGRLPDPSEPLAARTRRAYDEAAWTGYEVVLPVWREVIAYGILLVPKELKPGERRPVVVCQHGLEGRPQDTIEAKGEKAYARFAARLAEAGYVVYAPQNPYIGRDRFRQIQRKANPLGLSLFSFIVGQHQRTLEWLASLPFTDGKRIGFYGLSYGGKTAVRVPPLLHGYALSICSADFNEWIRKNTLVDEPFSYMYTGEYEMPEFNLGNTFNYAELASLMIPRPFMVERGHRDGVGIDEWVAYEYAKVRRLYTFLGTGERTTIEFFNGPHRIHGVETFEFLRRWLEWR
jgi:dienelactone hydrolase